jgi:hypothetical protein
VRQRRIAVPVAAHLDDIKENNKTAKGTEPSVQSFVRGNVGRVKVQGQFWSDTVVPYDVGVFSNLKVTSNKERERERQ